MFVKISKSYVQMCHKGPVKTFNVQTKNNNNLKSKDSKQFTTWNGHAEANSQTKWRF